ncbi:hypothetical protein V5O48_017992 [Marasmius crinis-equi]|uniref:Uncharacterized protein n=1 Tax=Marasmius crinis-equi TaxID=585013 RepID=A0ABR3EMF2_9AGAR
MAPNTRKRPSGQAPAEKNPQPSKKSRLPASLQPNLSSSEESGEEDDEKDSSEKTEGKKKPKAKLVEWDSDQNLTWSLLQIIQDSAELREGLYPGGGDGKAQKKNKGVPKSEYHTLTARLLFEKHAHYKVKFSQATSAEQKGKWGLTIKNRLSVLEKATRKYRTELGTTGEGIKREADIDMTRENTFTTKWAEIKFKFPWFFEMRELIGNRPSHVPTGIGNSTDNVDLSVLDPAEGDEEIQDGEDDGEEDPATGGNARVVPEPEITFIEGGDDVDAMEEDGLEVDELDGHSGDEGKRKEESAREEFKRLVAECDAHDGEQKKSSDGKEKPGDATTTKKKSKSGDTGKDAVKGKKTGPGSTVSKPSQTKTSKTAGGKGTKINGVADRFADVAGKEEDTRQKVIEFRKTKVLAHSEETKQRLSHRAMRKEKDQELRSRERIRKLELEHEFRMEEMRLRAATMQNMQQFQPFNGYPVAAMTPQQQHQPTAGPSALPWNTNQPNMSSSQSQWNSIPQSFDDRSSQGWSSPAQSTLSVLGELNSGLNSPYHSTPGE